MRDSTGWRGDLREALIGVGFVLLGTVAIVISSVGLILTGEYLINVLF